LANDSESARSINVIGIDCAAQPKNVGLALGSWRPDRKTISETAAARTWPEIVSIIRDWVSGPTLLALDAPLGWPSQFGPALRGHIAGEAIAGEANQLFRRRTDDVVHALLKKRPLDIGADRIARAALATLRLLADVREDLNQPVPLCWNQETLAGTQAIEVYPAATLKERGFIHTGYKGSDVEARSARASISEKISGELEISSEALAQGHESDHLLDGMVCVVAGFDFLGGLAIAPEDHELAEREGWIWVRRPQ
jgi:predicted nuclease with RNAse H fold